MKRFLMATAAIAVSAATAASAQDWHGHGQGGHGRGGADGGQVQQAAPQPTPSQGSTDGQARWGDRAEGRQVHQHRQGSDASGGPDASRWSGRRDSQPAAGVPPQAVPSPTEPQRNDRRSWSRRDNPGGTWSGGQSSRFGEGSQARQLGQRPAERRDGRGYVQRDRHGRGTSWSAQRRFHVSAYRAPYGYGYSAWSFGQILPPAYFAEQYVIEDFWTYDLPEPPYGMVWVRSGSDALLVDASSGYVAEVVRDLFW
jgi:Ni/Co efflux regulator RcnB